MGFRRHRYLVNKKFQLKVMFFLFSIIFAGSVSIGGVLYFVLKKKLSDLMYTTHFSILNLNEVLGRSIAVTFIIVTVATIIVCLIVLFILIKRVEKEIESFKNKSTAAGKGDLTIRPTDKYNDLTHNLSKNFDEMIGSLECGFSAIRQDLNHIIEVEVKIKKMVQNGVSREEYGKISSLLSQKFEKLNIELDKYRNS